jgi:hypothetical protein
MIITHGKIGLIHKNLLDPFCYIYPFFKPYERTTMNIQASKLLKIMLIVSFGIFASFFAGKVLASKSQKIIIEIYGTKQLTAEDVEDRYGKELKKIVRGIKSPKMRASEKFSKEAKYQLEKVRDDIATRGGFAFVKMETVMSVMPNVFYYNIDIVEKKDSKRLVSFSPEPNKSLPDPDNLIATWNEYENLAFKKMFKAKKIVMSDLSCPVFYCIPEVKDPAFKKYNNIFAAYIEKDKSQLADILHQDKDAKKRAAAVMLLARTNNGNELIKILVPAMHDADSNVRTNAMRTLGGVVREVKTNDFPIKDVVAALNYPLSDDRSAALALLESLASQPNYARYIKAHAADELMIELKMQSHQIHDTTYNILEKISGKKFDDHDYTAWQNWLDLKTV